MNVKPILGAVDKNQTVQGQMQGLLSSANPLLRQAQEQARRQAASSGLRNSSMATQAATEAMLGAALPIAQQDAATYQRQALDNQGVRNQFGMQANQFGQQRWLQNDGQSHALNVLGKQQGFEAGQAAADRNQQRWMQNDAQAAAMGILGQQQRFQGQQAALDRSQAWNTLQDQQAFQTGQNALDRAQTRYQFDKNAGLQQQQINNQNTQFNKGQTQTRALTYADMIGNIQNSNMTAEQKKTAMNNINLIFTGKAGLASGGMPRW